VKSDVQVFEIVQPIGMFATLSYCTLLAKACEEKGIEPYIIVSSPLYLSTTRGNDWFGYFFGHKRIELKDRDIAALRKEDRILVVRSRKRINRFARGLAMRELSNEIIKFSEAARLFGKYFYVKSHMLDPVGEFAAGNFDHSGQLGIHFRGTDHYHEYAFIDQRMMVDAANDYFPEYDSVFVATDEQEFLDFVRSHRPGKRIVTFMPAPPEHHQLDQRDNYQKGVHALADCLLLSRCQALIKTPSALSTWSKVFGPDLDLVLVGKPYSDPWKGTNRWNNLDGLGYFPESLLYRWDTAAMTENRVKAIIATPPEVPGAMKVASERLKRGALYLAAKARLPYPLTRLLAGKPRQKRRKVAT
jgi:hypothetical protein